MDTTFVDAGRRVVDIDKGYEDRGSFVEVGSPGRSEGLEGEIAVPLGTGRAVISGNNLWETGQGHHLVQLAEIAPGDRKYLHRHPLSETVWVVVAGEGQFFADLDTAVPVRAGMMCHAFPGEWHGLLNTGDVPLRYLSIEGPMFTRETSTEFAE